jgi:hypothetical protein
MKHRNEYTRFGVLISLSIIVASCEFLTPPPDYRQEIRDSYLDRAREQFNAHDFVKNESYTLEAVHLAENAKCVIYGEESALVSLGTAEKIAREFRDAIHPRITGVFGDYKDMDGDGKLTILLLDIKDGTALGSYLAGYFSSADMFARESSPNSNARDMLYMDTHPGVPGTASFYTTIAHELQHLINFSVSLEKRTYSDGGRERVHPLDTWIDEGLSSAAEYIYGQRPLVSRIDYFNNAGGSDSHIVQGNNFFVWQEDDYVMDEYATVYLFFQWLRIHSTGSDPSDPYGIYEAIINSPHSDYRAVLEAAANYIDPKFADDWESLIKTWLLANYVNDRTSLYGYRTEIRPTPKALGKVSEINLLPGEGVYSLLPNDDYTFSPPNKTGSSHIRYVGITRTGFLKESFEQLQGSNYRLLTFNANEDRESGSEQAGLTGTGDVVTEKMASHRAYSPGPIPLDGTSRLPGRGGPIPPAPLRQGGPEN